MSQQFVGRGREITALTAALERARTGRPRPLAITGASGSGKSMLLGVAANEAQAIGFRVLHLAGVAEQADEPFGVLPATLVTWSRTADARTDSLLAGLSAALSTPPSTARRVLVMEAVRQLVEAMAFATPVLVVVDDLQHLDPGTLDVVLFLMRHIRRHRVLVLAAVRDEDRSGDLGVDLRRFHDAGHLDELELAPFDDDELAALVTAHVGHPPDDHLLHVLRTRTGGMPFFAAELIGALAAQGLTPRADGRVSARGDGAPALPRRVATTVLHRVFMLGADARRVAAAVALVGHLPVERIPTLVAVTGLGVERTEEAFDRLVGSRVLVADGATYRFHHDIVRDAILSDLHPAARRRLHGSIAEVLADERRRGEERDIVEIGEHLRQSVTTLDPGAAALLREAGDATIDAAPARAARWYRLALARLPPDDAGVVDIQLRLGRALAFAGRHDEARRLTSAVARHLPPGPARLRALTRTARAAAATGRLEEAGSLLDQALAEQPRPPARLALDRALVHSWAGEDVDARRLVERAAGLGAPADDPLALTVRLDAAVAAGAFSEAASLAGALRALLPGAASPASRRHAALALCIVDALHLDPADAVAAAGAVGDGEPFAAWFRAAAAWANLRLGRLDDAVREGAAARHAIDPRTGDLALGLVVPALVRSHLEQGDVARADEVAAWSRTMPIAALETRMDCASARVHTARGDHVLAAEVLRRAVARETAGGRVDTSAMVLAEELEAAQAAGRPATSRAAGRRLRQLPCDGGSIAVTMDRLLAAVVTDRRPADAAAALDHARSHGLAIDAARALAMAGDIAGDTAVLGEAFDELGRLGAVVRQARVGVRLRALGRRPSTGRRVPAGALSAIEREVAGLVADGLTNRQIGERVNLSPKTIEVYLSRVYAKTACRSRVELATAVRAGTLPTSA